jgi:hypothetical protein
MQWGNTYQCTMLLQCELVTCSSPGLPPATDRELASRKRRSCLKRKAVLMQASAPQVLVDEKLADNAQRQGEKLRAQLGELQRDGSRVTAVRGKVLPAPTRTEAKVVA